MTATTQTRVPVMVRAQLHTFPCTLKQANALVASLHRHHKPATGHRFSIGVEDETGKPHGAIIVGRAVAPKTDQNRVAEASRAVTDGTPNACSFLYGAAARAAQAMGYDRIQTFILAEEDGASLKAAGWEFDGWTGSPVLGWLSREGRDGEQPQGDKQRWVRRFR